MPDLAHDVADAMMFRVNKVPSEPEISVRSGTVFTVRPADIITVERGEDSSLGRRPACPCPRAMMGGTAVLLEWHGLHGATGSDRRALLLSARSAGFDDPFWVTLIESLSYVAGSVPAWAVITRHLKYEIQFQQVKRWARYFFKL